MEHIKNYDTSDEELSPPFSPIIKDEFHKGNSFHLLKNDATTGEHTGKEINSNFECMEEDVANIKPATSNGDETQASDAEEMEIGNDLQKKQEKEESCEEELCREGFCERERKTFKRYVSRERSRMCYRSRSSSRSHHESRYERYRSQNQRSSKTHFKKTSTYQRKRYRSPSTSSSSDYDKDAHRYSKTRQEKVRNKLQKLGIKKPEYFNPTLTKSSVFAEQLQKRRNLWKNNYDEVKAESTQDVGSSVQNSSSQIFEHSTTKMKRLLGIKNKRINPVLNEEVKKSLETENELMTNMEEQYNVARSFTHSYRGAGLGFLSFKKPSP